MLTLTKGIGDKREMDEAKEHYVELFEAGKDPAETFEPPEQALDFVALLVQRAVIVPGSIRLDLGGTTGIMPKSSTSCRV